ncbi:uncharacterized protein LOC117803800 [Ailuropoda melanoleuca]|uniref:uncharacterized protein LOC117803800 n=1 Tax=Ailuropoda melanoleuca TaxID=9646 RepID=UPI0014946A4F|nr:uncharacterized protein LOC117803800 [Ailuropoda melanoleuca]
MEGSGRPLGRLDSDLAQATCPSTWRAGAEGGGAPTRRVRERTCGLRAENPLGSQEASPVGGLQPLEEVAGGAGTGQREGSPRWWDGPECQRWGGHRDSKEQAPVRGGAIFLFGDVIYSGGRKYRQVLKSFAFQALVPLLFHLVDSCPKVVMNTKLTFLRCAILLKWEFRKELFGKLAWGHGLGAENDIFIYMVESNFGNYHQFLMQALIYLASPHKNLKHTAMKFIGGILKEYFTDLCFSLKKSDLKVLRKCEPRGPRTWDLFVS